MGFNITIAGTAPVTMSSREIADLVEKRHDNVKRAVDMLVDRGVVAIPQIESVAEAATTPTGGRRTYTTTVYRLDKRSSLIVVAQLSPEFTARVVDRWQELEERANGPALPDFTNPVAAARAWADQVERVERQAVQIEDMRATVEAHDRIASAKGSMSVTEAAKALGVCPQGLFGWMSRNGWIYRRPGVSAWLGYQTKCNQGLLEHKVTTVLRADGREKIAEQVRVTPKGLAKLALVV